MTHRKLGLIGISLAAFTAFSAPAFADAALLSHDVTLLAGPGANFGNVAHVPAKAHVGVLWCGNAKFDWCLIDFHDKGGWVHIADLELLGPDGAPIDATGHGVPGRAQLPDGLSAAPAGGNEGACFSSCGPDAGSVGPGGVKGVGGGL